MNINPLNTLMKLLYNLSKLSKLIKIPNIKIPNIKLRNKPVYSISRDTSCSFISYQDSHNTSSAFISIREEDRLLLYPLAYKTSNADLYKVSIEYFRTLYNLPIFISDFYTRTYPSLSFNVKVPSDFNPFIKDYLLTCFNNRDIGHFFIVYSISYTTPFFTLPTIYIKHIEYVNEDNKDKLNIIISIIKYHFRNYIIQSHIQYLSNFNFRYNPESNLYLWHKFIN